MSDKSPTAPPDPKRVAWAQEGLRNALTGARETRQSIWVALRDRVMTISAGTIALSLLALQLNSDPSCVYLIKISWSALLASIIFGFVSLIVDYQHAVRTERSVEASNKLTYGIIDEESIEKAETLNRSFSRWNRPSGLVADWSVYLGLIAFLVGMSFLIAFAWRNV